MKKKIQVTENELRNIINNVINESLGLPQKNDLDNLAEKIVNCLDDSDRKFLYHQLKHNTWDIVYKVLSVLDKYNIKDYEDIDPDDFITNWGEHNYDI